METYSNIKAAKKQAVANSEDNKDNKISGNVGNKTASILVTQYQLAQQKLRFTITAAERKQVKANRQQFFATVGARTLEMYHSGLPEPGNLEPVKFESLERAKLANLLFPDASSTFQTHEEAILYRYEIVTALATLCLQRIPAPTNFNGDREEHDVSKNLCPDFEPTVPPPDSPFNMKVPGFQCLFCLAEQTLVGRARTHNFSNTFTLIRHVYNQHLTHMDTTEPFLCLYPVCKAQGAVCTSVEHFFAHIWRVHNVYHCRRLD